MNKYYGLVTDAKGVVNYVIDNLSDSRSAAERELREHCKKHNLIYQSLLPVRNKQREGNVLTKYAKARKVLNGKLGRIK